MMQHPAFEVRDDHEVAVMEELRRGAVRLLVDDNGHLGDFELVEPFEPKYKWWVIVYGLVIVCVAVFFCYLGWQFTSPVMGISGVVVILTTFLLVLYCHWDYVERMRTPDRKMVARVEFLPGAADAVSGVRFAGDVDLRGESMKAGKWQFDSRVSEVRVTWRLRKVMPNVDLYPLLDAEFRSLARYDSRGEFWEEVSILSIDRTLYDQYTSGNNLRESWEETRALLDVSASSVHCVNVPFIRRELVSSTKLVASLWLYHEWRASARRAPRSAPRQH